MKPSTAKTKGRETENLWVEYLQRHGIAAERRRLNGVLDKGDIAGWDFVCSEVKSGAQLSIPKWLAELDVEMFNSGAETGHVVVRPKGKPKVDDWFVILPVNLYMDLMKKAGYV